MRGEKFSLHIFVYFLLPQKISFCVPGELLTTNNTKMRSILTLSHAILIFAASLAFAQPAFQAQIEVTFPSSPSESCEKLFSENRLERARSVLSTMGCPPHGEGKEASSFDCFAEDISYSDGNVIANGKSDVIKVFRNILSPSFTKSWAVKVLEEFCDESEYIATFEMNATMANGNVRNAPGISFIEFDEENEDKVVRWRDYLSELKAYDYIPLVKNLLKRKKVCLLGDEGCGNITPQSSLENVSSDYEEKSTVPNEISSSCSKYFTSDRLRVARSIVQCNAGDPEDCMQNFADEIVYTDGNFVAENKSFVSTVFKNMFQSNFASSWSISIVREVCTSDGAYIPRWSVDAAITNEALKSAPGASLIKFASDDEDKATFQQDYLPELKIYGKTPVLGPILTNYSATLAKCLTSDEGC